MTGLFAIDLPAGFYEFYRSIPVELHPAVVHFPVALLMTAALFDVLYALTKRVSLESAGFWCLLFGALGGVLAVLTGLAEEGTLGHHTERGHELMERHETLGLALLGLFGLLLIWRLVTRGALPHRGRALFVLLMLVGAAGLGFQGWLGGEMVFSETLGVEMGAMKQVVAAEAAGGGHEHGGAGEGGHGHVQPDASGTQPAAAGEAPPALPGRTPGPTTPMPGAAPSTENDHGTHEQDTALDAMEQQLEATPAADSTPAAGATPAGDEAEHDHGSHEHP